MKSRSEPTSTTAPALAISSVTSGSCGGAGTSIGWPAGRTPRPWYVVTTGAPSAVASAATPSPASRAPPPTHSNGRSTSASAATISRTDGFGSPLRWYALNADAPALSTSVGTPRYTGPVGAAVASATAFATTAPV